MLALVDYITYMHCYNNIIHNIASYSVHLQEYNHYMYRYVRLCTKH